MIGKIILYFLRKNIARFEKVSLAEFKIRFIKLYIDECDDKEIMPSIRKVEDCLDLIEPHYDQIILPARQTKGSAGYDFVVPFDFTLRHGEVITIPTGIKAFIKEGWVMKIYPRSTYGLMGIQIENTTPIIDEDYYGNPKTEGHILLKISNNNKFYRTINFYAGDRIAQATFDIYGLAEEPNPPKAIRNGGTGSTNKIQK